MRHRPDQRRLLRLRPVVLDTIPADREVSVEQETFPQLVAEGRRVFGHTTEDYWRDLGTPLAFVHGSADLVTGKATSPLVETPADNLIHPTAVIDPTARVTVVRRSARRPSSVRM